MEVASWMDRRGMFPAPGGLILCAVSGGEDSMCLLHLLWSMGKERNFRVAAVHLNHLMRGEDATRDEAFVRAFCEERNIPFYIGRCDVREKARAQRLSVEEAGRQARYELFYQTADAIGAEKIATAHHAMDQAETVLLHLVRGTGAEGLRGIPPVRGRLIRPLLNTSKAEIRAYCEENGLSHVEDSTNQDLTLSRNRVRRLVMPELLRINPALEAAVCRTAAILSEEDAYLDQLARERLEPGTLIDRQTLLGAPRALQGRMLRALIDRLGVGKKDFSAAHIASLLTLAEKGREGSCLHLPQHVCAEIAGGRLTLSLQAPPPPAELTLERGENRWGRYRITVFGKNEKNVGEGDTIFLKCDMMKQRLSVRAWRGEDRLRLPGSRGARSCKRLFAERGIRASLRDALPVLCVDGHAAAAYSVGTDETFLGAECAVIIETTDEI